jgi:arabinose-5-phosphate isomerase
VTNLNKKIITTAQNVLLQEAKAIESLISAIDDTFSDAVEAILGSTGRLVISGIGKSAIIAQKIVATMNSTGQPAVFMHAADAIHGDLGMIQPSDIVLVISKSGSTPEIKVLLPLIKRLGNKMIALVSDTSSYLATQSDFVLSAHVEKLARLILLPLLPPPLLWQWAMPWRFVYSNIVAFRNRILLSFTPVGILEKDYT